MVFEGLLASMTTHLQLLVLIVAGKVEGVFQSWHENGQLAERIQMMQGQPDGEAWGCYASGFAKAKTFVRAGQMLAQTHWADSEYR